MANLKISELPVLAAIQTDSPFAVVDMSASPIETKQVVMSGMTFKGGSTSYNATSGIADPATPISFTGDSTEFIITGDTFNIVRAEANSITTATVTYKTAGGSASDISYFRLDVNGSGGRDIYLPDTAGAWASVSFVGRANNLTAGSQNLDLTMNLANSVIFDFAQIYIGAFER